MKYCDGGTTRAEVAILVARTSRVGQFDIIDSMIRVQYVEDCGISCPNYSAKK